MLSMPGHLTWLLLYSASARHAAAHALVRWHTSSSTYACRRDNPVPQMEIEQQLFAVRNRSPEWHRAIHAGRIPDKTFHACASSVDVNARHLLLYSHAHPIAEHDVQCLIPKKGLNRLCKGRNVVIQI